jgi:hypothetical protein
MSDRIDELEMRAATHRAGLAVALTALTQPSSGATAGLPGGIATQLALNLASGLLSSRRAKVKAKADQAADAANASARQMRARLAHGLEDLDHAARNKVIAARQKAIKAQEEIERRAARAKASVKATHAAHPVATTLAVVGIGALIGALIPTRRSGKSRERTLAEARDAELRHAEEILAMEAAALHAARARHAEQTYHH